MHVKPADGLKVMDPRTKRHIPAEGVKVSDSDTYWARRIRAGDVLVVKESAPAPIRAKRMIDNSKSEV